MCCQYYEILSNIKEGKYLWVIEIRILVFRSFMIHSALAIQVPAISFIGEIILTNPLSVPNRVDFTYSTVI